MKTFSLRATLPALLAGLFALLLLLGGAPRASAADTNSVKGIATVTTSDGPRVEITLTSTRPFDVRNDALLLQVGATTFTLSHAPADGSLNTIVFVMTPAQFAATSAGDPVVAYFGSGSPTGPDAWNFGKLDKGLLK